MKNITGLENTMYMNPHSGEVAPYGGWDYTDEDGNSVNAVDKCEVIEVQWNYELEMWETVE